MKTSEEELSARYETKTPRPPRDGEKITLVLNGYLPRSARNLRQHWSQTHRDNKKALEAVKRATVLIGQCSAATRLTGTTAPPA